MDSPVQDSVGARVRRYRGMVAWTYDADREGSPMWEAEDRAIKAMLSDLPHGRDEKGRWRTTVLDVPVGAGRFLPFYTERGFAVIGVDKERDMLDVAAGRELPYPLRVTLRQGDVRNLPVADGAVDVALMCRMTRWLSPADCQRAMKELQRVARSRIIWTARVKHASKRVLDRPVALFEAALSDGWRITRNEAGHEETYRILMAER